MNANKVKLCRVLSLLAVYCCFSYNAFCQSMAPIRAKGKKPNIIFILTDDQRWDALGYAGNKWATTPQMDELARSGTYFKHAISTTPICAASRASIISGLYERTHKYTFETGPIRDEYMQDAYPRLLQKAGYHTGFFGKFGVKYDNLKLMFDVVDDYDRNGKYTDRRGYFYKKINGDTVHLTRFTGQQGLDFIQDAPTDKPFCLQLSFSAPHAHDNAPDQYFWQPETDHLYKNVSMPLAEMADDKYFNELPEKVKSGFNRLRWTWRFDTPEKYQHSLKGYYRMIAGVDMEIAKIRSLLKRKGLDDNTIIILMGDNGYFLGERQLAGKWLMYEQSVRVPLIVYDPRAKKHFDSNEQALNVDVPATILDAAGIKQPATWHGKSLLPLASGTTQKLDRDTVLIEHLWEFENIPPSEGVRTNDWKYFRYVNDKSPEYLYNLKSDPKETSNLAKDKKYSMVLNALRAKCYKLITKYKDPYSGVPSGLMVNYIREPALVSINNNTPQFTWIVPAEAVAQSAYQVIVASTQNNINNNVGDVWNSKQVKSSSSSNITYTGKPLTTQQTYYWKVRVWDKDNRLSDYSPARAFQVTAPTAGFSPANNGEDN